MITQLNVLSIAAIAQRTEDQRVEEWQRNNSWLLYFSTPLLPIPYRSNTVISNWQPLRYLKSSTMRIEALLWIYSPSSGI
ncbi:hypothetical protein H6G89_10470 [Oscillatoria sp. FACHB-1407]|uniref:hypothetical protein n=1 Tax=Oscillatoria sp. FACHB-1407 TaxID=2692847 RepID=UPI0016899925|nr:hypothetical protein [Oscillatoria sp. FACHB-1407]MBD2461473.1 hypothetical protein [Oscillatoria sp. FACHB-1407]